MPQPSLTSAPPSQIVFVIRLSIIPSHMSTAVFSTCDVKFWHFVVSTFFTLPKQLILVYLGVLLVGGQSDFWIKFGLFGVAGGVTVLAGVWIWYKMRSIKKELLAAQERRRATKESRQMTSGGGLHPQQAFSETTPLGRNNSYQDLPQDRLPHQYHQEPHAYSPPSGGGYGYAQTTPYPEDHAGDLGMYGRAEYDSPEQKKAVHPYGFV